MPASVGQLSGPRVPVQITRDGLRVNLSERGIERLRHDFECDNYIVLPHLIEPALLRMIQAQIERANFTARVHRGFGRDLQLRRSNAAASFALLLNNRELFAIVERVTGCGPVGSLIGSVRRAMPGPGNSLGWHSDNLGHRKVAITINLGRKPYAGGRLQIRRAASGRIVAEVSNTAAGNAVVFRIAEKLQHRNTAVEGKVAKTAFSGWLVAKPRFETTLTRELTVRTKSTLGKSTIPSRRRMSPNVAVVVPPEIASHGIGRDTLLLNFGNGRCFGLDPIGTEIWKLIARGLSPRAASRVIARSYDAPALQVEGDILRLLAELHARGLLDRTQ